LILIQSNPDIAVHFSFTFHSSVYTFDSKTLEASIAPVPLSEPAILRWIESEINSNIQHCKGESNHEKS